MRKAFTLIEVVVALGILAMILSFAGVIFRVSIESQRLAMANAEILQKLRIITGQLDSDLRGLRKDGEMLVFWRAMRKPNYTPPSVNHPSAFERFDTIMFFASGDFYSYNVNPPVRGNTARICYTLANFPGGPGTEPNRPQAQKPQKRVLARTQHILLPPPNSIDPNDPLGTLKFSDSQWRDWNSIQQSDGISLRGWQLMSDAVKADVISVIGDVKVGSDTGLGGSEKNKTVGGVILDRTRPDSLPALLCDGVGQFEVQGWNDAERRWMPEVDPNGNGVLSDDSDFILEGEDLNPSLIPGIRYPDGPFVMRTFTAARTNAEFRDIPGLGRAMKFTFTLYDSRGLIPNGRTFTHIVYLDD